VSENLTKQLKNDIEKFKIDNKNASIEETHKHLLSLGWCLSLIYFKKWLEEELEYDHRC
jgi:hypothetical protein